MGAMAMLSAKVAVGSIWKPSKHNIIVWKSGTTNFRVLYLLSWYWQVLVNVRIGK